VLLPSIVNLLSFRTVGQDSHHLVPPVVNVKSGQDVGARGSTDQQTFLFGKPARSFNRFVVRNGEHHIYQVHIEHIRYKPIADALNLMQSWFSPQ